MSSMPRPMVPLLAHGTTALVPWSTAFVPWNTAFVLCDPYLSYGKPVLSSIVIWKTSQVPWVSMDFFCKGKPNILGD
jgi:hypothetical protein